MRRGDLLESTLVTMALPRDCHVIARTAIPRNDSLDNAISKIIYYYPNFSNSYSKFLERGSGRTLFVKRFSPRI